jgi:hypothetical protein
MHEPSGWIGAQEDVVAASTGYFRFFAASTPLAVTSAISTAIVALPKERQVAMAVALELSRYMENHGRVDKSHYVPPPFQNAAWSVSPFWH